MAALIACFYLIGIGLILFGMLQKKSPQSQPHYQTAKIVGYKNVAGENLCFDVLNYLMEVVQPVACVILDDGSFKEVPMHLQVTMKTLEIYPNLKFGGEADVLFYGDNPRICYLCNHPLAEKPVQFSSAIVIGIAFLVLGVICTIVALMGI